MRISTEISSVVIYCSNLTENRYYVTYQSQSDSIVNERLLSIIIQSVKVAVFRRMDEGFVDLQIFFRLSKNDTGLSEVLLDSGFSSYNDEDLFSITISSVFVKNLLKFKDRLKDVYDSSGSISCSLNLDELEHDEEILDYLIKEYNLFLWGRSEIARHQDISSDEFDVICKYVFGDTAMEVGCGSGRMTFELSKRVNYLVASDAVEGIVRQFGSVKCCESNISFVLDDICNSSFADKSFDLLMFWENGLGAILKTAKREKAINEMVRLLRPGGILILGLRQLENSPIDNLMVTPQNDQIMGIYHTFTPQEVLSMIPEDMTLIEHIQGSERSAGGRAFFLIFKK